MKRSNRTTRALLVVTATLSGCGGGKPQGSISQDTSGNGGQDAGGSSAAATGGRSTASGGQTSIFTPTGGASAEGGATAVDPCVLTTCGVGQRCVAAGTSASCVDVTCAELTCKDTEECRAATGGGNVCVSVACTTDAECPVEQYCNGTRCVDDVCTADARSCNAGALQICGSNGGGQTTPYACSSKAYFDSTCTSTSVAACSCQDDWDCPAFTVCESRVCDGTGVAPTCTLPPVDFAKALPKSEMHWGGVNRANPNAVDATGAVSPFQWSNQVASAPMVANLDDDNGDGLIDELDFPEIIFVSHSGTDVNTNGVVRAIHGGGPNKGKDYFATCGDPSSNAGTSWFESQAVVQDCNSNAGDETSLADALVRPGAMVAVGDIDADGRPEIVVGLETAGFLLLDNRGLVLLRSPDNLWTNSAEQWKYPLPAIVNLDLTGFAELVIGNRVFTFTKTNDKFAIGKIYVGSGAEGVQHQVATRNLRHDGPAVCPADLIASRPGLEFVAGTTLYALPTSTAANCGTATTPCPLDIVWDAAAVNGTALSAGQREGFCAVADVLGANTADAPGPNNPLDAVAEVIVVANGYLLVLESATGKILRQMNLQDGTTATFDCVGGTVNCVSGGAPNVDDFDGDGFPEVATAMQLFYQVVDFQAPNTSCPAWPNRLDAAGAPPQTNPARNPGGLDANGTCKDNTDCAAGAVCNRQIGQCVCLHNGWKRNTEDDSSAVTSSSVFDFNGDGAAEVVYADECYFRVYNGTNGGVYLQLPSVNRTLVDNPVVADVDNDGNAEIIAVQNSAYQQCGQTSLNTWPIGSGTVTRDSLPNGIEVYGDQSDTWVAARRVWNQHAYHVTNVLESGAIPMHEPESWKPWNGRLYNTYRSQPRNYDVAPDLVPTGIQVFSPNVACGTLSNEIQITVLVKNAGDLRVGPGVVLQFFGIWDNAADPIPLVDSTGAAITTTVTKSLEPGSSTLTAAVSYQSGNGGQVGLPKEVRVMVDANQSASECIETNNIITGSVSAGEVMADLRLVLDKAAGCTPPKIDFTLHNDGTVAASNVVVRVYAGDPATGGIVLGEAVVAGPIAASGSVTGQIAGKNLSRNVTVWGFADPGNVIRECNDANNIVQGPALQCDVTTPIL